MNKYLDLNVFLQKTMDLKMPDGDFLCIEKPTVEMFVEFEKFQNTETKNQKDEEVMNALDEMCLKILNTNTQRKKVTLDGLNFQMKFAIVRAYCKFVTEITTQKN